MKKAVLGALMLGFAVAVAGCGGGGGGDAKPEATKKPPVDERQQAITAWAGFVEKVKANVPQAKEATKRDRKLHDVFLVFQREDVKKSDSIKFPYVGEIDFEKTLHHGRDPLFGKPRYNRFHTTYRFGWISGRWKLVEVAGKVETVSGDDR